jgi:CBS-domain-containing membrane protein
MKVSELMHRDLTSLDPSDTIRTLVETLESSETSSVPVTDAENRLLGIVSERDVLSAAVPRYMELLHSATFMPNLNQLAIGLNRIADEPVHLHMSRKVISVPIDGEDLQAADLMLRHKLRLLPVVDDKGGLVGIVRRIDLFKHVL